MNTEEPTNNTPQEQATAPNLVVAVPETANTSKFPKAVNIKTIIITIAILAVIGLLYYYRGLFVAATVNGKPISRLAVVKQLEKTSGASTLDNMITESLIKQAADEQGITLDGNEVDDRVKGLETQFTTQGTTLDAALNNEGLSKQELIDQISLQIKAEKILKDKLTVSDEELDAYLKTNSITFDAGQEDTQKAQVREQVKQEKFRNELNAWLTNLRNEAKIKKFTNY